MPPVRNRLAIPKRRYVKVAAQATSVTENENSNHMAIDVIAKANVAAATRIPRAALKKHVAVVAPSRGTLGEVTNATALQAQAESEIPAVVRRPSKNDEDTPKERTNPEVFFTPKEDFEDEIDEFETMEIDVATDCFTGANGRTVDLATGKELVYDLSKVEDHDGPNGLKLEEYADYAQDVFRHYRQRELDPQFAVDPNYMTRQKDLNWSLRAVLVDWIVDLQESFSLAHETLYLAVKILDLYLTNSKKCLPKEKLQLLGITCVFIASKYEERNNVRVDDLVYMTEDSYKTKQVFKMEVEVLKTIGFQLGLPMSYRFLRRFAKTKHMSMEDLTLARYILETSLLDHCFVGVRESHLAAGALFLARRMVDRGGEVWDDTLIHYSAIDRETARDMALKLNAMLRRRNEKLETVQRKYEHKVFMQVATIPKISDEALV